MTTSQGLTRTALLVLVAGAALVAGVLVWLLFPPTSAKPPVVPVGDRAEAQSAPQSAPTTRGPSRAITASRLTEDDAAGAAESRKSDLEIEVPAGVSISGRVELDGHAPGEPVEFQMYGGPYLDAFHPTFVSSPAGDFEIRGLEKGSEWRFRAGDAAWQVESVTVGTADGEVIAPASGVLIKVKRFPAVRGRVVVGESRQPVPEATCVFETIGATGSMSQTRKADAGGRFAFAVQKTLHEKVVLRNKLTVHGPNRVGSKVVTLEPPPDRDVDLGDLEVPAGRTLHYLVRDPAGVPIEGALARSEQIVNPSTRTDRKGLGTIVVEPDQRSFWVGALKYEVAEVALPDHVPDPIPVVLQPCSGLEVRIATSSGTPLDALKVKLTSEVERPFRNETDPTGNDVLYAAAGATDDFEGSWSPEGSSFTFPIPADGRVLVPGLKPGVAVTLAAVDRLDHVHASAAVTLAPGEWKTIELRVTKPSRSLKGRVRDAAGKPIETAYARIAQDAEAAGRRGACGLQFGATTDEEGRFTIAGVFERTVHLAVEKEGYALLVQRDLALPPDGAELDLRLVAGCRIDVKVVDSAGTPLGDLDVTAEVGGEITAQASERERGSYSFTDLPCDRVATISVRSSWSRESKRTVQVKDGHFETVILPSPGKIVVDYSEIGDAPYLLELRADGEAKEPVTLIIETGPSTAPRVYDAGPVRDGIYQATLKTFERPDSPSVPIAGPQRVTVRLGETTRIVFKKP